MEPSDILLENIRDKIPPILHSKLLAIKIRDLGQVLSINPDEFFQRRGVGKTVKNKLVEFQKQIKKNLGQFEIWQNEKIKVQFLPIDENYSRSSDMLDSFTQVVNDFLKMLQCQEHRLILIQQYGLNKAEKRFMSDMGRSFSLTKERVRQIKNDMLQELADLFNGGINAKYQCQVRKEVVKKFAKIHNHLANNRVLAYSQIIEILRNNYSCSNAANQRDIIDLFIDISGFVRCSRSETLFTEANLVVLDKAYRKQFLIVAEETLRLLKNGILSFTEKEIVEGIRESTDEIMESMVRDALMVLPEVEQINKEGVSCFQIRFGHLSSAADKAFRVLSEHGVPMHIEDITSEINRLHGESGILKTYDRNSLVISTDARFTPLAKTGYWSLQGWNRNTDTIVALVHNALLKLNKPSSFEDIYHLISGLRPELSMKSIRSTIGRHCIKVLADQWILPEWSEMYADLPLAKRRKLKKSTERPYRTKQRALIMDYLANKEGRKAPAAQIIKDLSSLDKHFTQTSFYKLFGENAHFQKEGKERITVKLKV
jgi:hypothetical protein